MSADNYYVIRKDRQGYFVPIMGFASSNGAPLVRATDPRFKDFHAAIEYAALEYTEYGINVDNECYSDAVPVHFRRLTTGHYATCPAQDNTPVRNLTASAKHLNLNGKKITACTPNNTKISPSDRKSSV